MQVIYKQKLKQLTSTANMPTYGYDKTTGQKIELPAGADISQYGSLTSVSPTLKALSVGLAQGTIQNQQDVNNLYGNSSYGNSVPDANASTTRNTASPIPAKPVDPILALSPEQRAEFSKQFSIALSKGQVTDQASIDAFKTQFAQGAQSGYSPTLASTQVQAYGTPTGTSATMQNQLGGASNSSSPYYSRYSQSEQQASDYLNTFEKPKTEEEILAEKTKNAQGEIDAVNRYYESLLLDQSRVNDTREREANAQSVLQGLSGSTEAGARKVQAENISAGENAKIQAARGAQIQGIYRQIQTEAYNAAQTERTNARESATGILNRAEARTAKEEAAMLAQQQKGIENAKLLASSGIDLVSLKQKDPTTYKYLVDSAGGEQYLSALFTLNRPQEDVLDKKIEGGKYVIAYKNPLTGSVRVETVDLGLPQEYSKTVDAGDRILAIPDNWDGDAKKLITINKGLTPVQASKIEKPLSDGFSEDIKSAAQSIFDGKSKLNEYPSAKRLTINSALEQLYKAEGGDQLAQGAYDAITSLESDIDKNRGFSHAIGANILAGFGKNMPGSDSASFLAKLDQLKANIKLVNIKYLKGTGALSDAEGKTLEDAGTSLSPSLPEKQFKEELARVKLALEKANNVQKAPPTGAIPKGTDGEAYGYPGYVSDGTQWVLK